MGYTGLIIFSVIGAIVGWLAGVFMKGRGFSLLGNIIIGIVGAITGGLLFSLLFGLLGFIGSIATAIAGSAVLLFIAWVITKSKNPS